MSEHTPKPWTYAAVSEGHILGGPPPMPGKEDERVLVCRDINADDVPLILSAPALLEALKETLGALGDIWEAIGEMPSDPGDIWPDELESYDKAGALALAAIKQAEGK